MQSPKRPSARHQSERSSSPPLFFSTNNNNNPTSQASSRATNSLELPTKPLLGTVFDTFVEGKREVQAYFKACGDAVVQAHGLNDRRKVVDLVCREYEGLCPVRVKFRKLDDGRWELFKWLDEHDHSKPGIISSKERHKVRRRNKEKRRADEDEEESEQSEEGGDSDEEMEDQRTTHSNSQTSIREGPGDAISCDPSESSGKSDGERAPTPGPSNAKDSRPRNIQELEARIAGRRKKRVMVEASTSKHKADREKREEDRFRELQKELKEEEERLRKAEANKEKEEKMEIDVKREMEWDSE